MGYIFEAGDVTVWSPGNQWAEVFLLQLKSLELLIPIKSGLTEPMADTVEVDSRQLSIFLEAIASFLSRNNNLALKMMLGGVIIHLMAIYEKCEGSAVSSGIFDLAWTEAASAMAARSMPV